LCGRECPGVWVCGGQSGTGAGFLPHKDGEFLNHIVGVKGDETWVLFVDVETKEQSEIKAVDAHTFIKQAEKV
jgi:hypothetical protein